MKVKSGNFECLVKGYQVKKDFKVGESVRIIQGRRAGEVGVISQLISGPDGNTTAAALTLGMEDIGTDKTSLTIATQNLRLKHEVDPNTQSMLNQNLFTKNIN